MFKPDALAPANAWHGDPLLSTASKHAGFLTADWTAVPKVGFERVVLSTWAFSEASAAVVGEALRRLPRLRSLVAADIIAGRPEAQGLAVYRALGAALRAPVL